MLELMLVMALVAVILAMGAPAFRDFRLNSRLTGLTNDFVTAVQAARTEAIKRQAVVTLCRSSQPSSADAACDGSSFDGWIVFADNDGNCARGSGEPVLRSGGTPDADVFAPANFSCLPFAPTGFLRTVAGQPLPGHLIFCDARGLRAQGGTSASAAHGIIVSESGRANVTRDAALMGDWSLACSG
jgi:type IV fimbrial biogenesis protein FimT